MGSSADTLPSTAPSPCGAVGVSSVGRASVADAWAVQGIRASLSRCQCRVLHAQRRAEVIDTPEKDRLPAIPGQQAEHDAATRVHDLYGDQHEGVEKGMELHPQDGGLSRRRSVRPSGPSPAGAGQTTP